MFPGSRTNPCHRNGQPEKIYPGTTKKKNPQTYSPLFSFVHGAPRIGGKEIVFGVVEA